MNKKTKVFIAIGGTGGHVFPGCNLATHLSEKNYYVKLITDKRGQKFIQKLENLDFFVIPSSPLNSKNFFSILLSCCIIFYSILRSLVFLISNRPKIIFGMGGYASFPICVAASILRIDYIIYENNLILGKANKYLLPFAKKMIVSFKELEGVPEKYFKKIFFTGNIIKKEIIDLSEKNSSNNELKKFGVLVLGGSQAAKIFAEVLPNIFKQCNDQGIKLKIFQHCLPSQNENLELFYEKNKIEFELFNFSSDLSHYFLKVNLAITRSGSSMLAELTNANLPFISVPLPSSADNHQLKNATYYKKKNYAFLIEEKDLSNRLLYLMKEIYENKSVLNKIIQSQRQYSDKNVYNNIDKVMEEIIDEKN